MQKICKHCSGNFEFTPEDRDFLDKLSTTINGNKYLIPDPTLCPDCRHARRLAHRNERFLFKRNCDLCKKPMIAAFDENTVPPVYCKDCWWSDKWDPCAYGRDFDFSRPFFEQFQELLNVVPKPAVIQVNNENCEYNTLLAYSKNTYLSPGSYFMEDCYFVRKSQNCKDCVDSNFLDHCELLHSCINCNKCYSSYYLINCGNCSNSSFLADCTGCKECFMCASLANKQYHFKNRPYSKDEYEKIVEEKMGLDPKELLKEFLEFSKTIPKKYQNQINCENSSGDYIQNCKNAVQCFDCFDVEDSKYLIESVTVKDSMDLSMHDKDIELCYELCAAGESNQNLKFSFCPYKSSNSEYLYSCFFLPDSFGCDGFHSHNKHCILNKKYSQEEYDELRVKIIEHMMKTEEYGEFFPAEISPLYYNETIANDYFPLSREEALKRGYKWRDKEEKEYRPSDVKVDLNVKDVPDSIVDEILACSDCGKNYKIIEQELQFCRRMNLPLSPYCQHCRYLKLLALKNPRKLWKRQCAGCNTEIETTYSPEGGETVYCEQCYLGAVY